MGHTNSTPNLHLPQFIGSDKPTWLSDVNDAMLAIDTAYGQIESDASAAATAASGAVTTATQANDTAASAAGTAATAASNASTALTTANNAAGTANTAYNEAHEALERVNGKVLATVTADGVKTWAQLLSELVDASVFAQIGANSYISHVTSATNEILRVAQIRTNRVDFLGLTMSLSGGSYMVSLRCAPGGSYENFIQSINAGGSITYADQSSEVPASGEVLTLYK